MKKDLIILVADKNIQFTITGLLSRHHALQIRQVSYDIYIHPEHDPGVYHKAGVFLRDYQSDFDHALVFLDREGSGQEGKSAEEIAEKVKNNLGENGWQGRGEVIVFDPELEIWLWVNSPHLSANSGWESLEAMHTYLREQGYWRTGSPKPNRPKEAFESALKEKRIPRSSAIYHKIARHASFRGCTDPSFGKFREILQQWFATTK